MCPLPFEDNYNITYRKKFLSKLNGPNLNKLVDIKNINQNKKVIHIKNKKENTFITAQKRKRKRKEK